MLHFTRHTTGQTNQHIIAQLFAELHAPSLNIYMEIRGSKITADQTWWPLALDFAMNTNRCVTPREFPQDSIMEHKWGKGGETSFNPFSTNRVQTLLQKTNGTQDTNFCHIQGVSHHAKGGNAIQHRKEHLVPVCSAMIATRIGLEHKQESLLTGASATTAFGLSMWVHTSRTMRSENAPKAFCSECAPSC